MCGSRASHIMPVMGGCLGDFPDWFGFVEPFERHFADPNDLYMFQCHILEHEDAGMMGHFVVVA